MSVQERKRSRISAEALGVGLVEEGERLVGEDDAPAEGVVGPVALVDRDLDLGKGPLHQDPEVETRRTPSDRNHPHDAGFYATLDSDCRRRIAVPDFRGMAHRSHPPQTRPGWSRRPGAGALLLQLCFAGATQAAFVLLDESMRGAAGGGDRSRITLVPAGEPGTPLRVTGQVVRPDGVTPAAGVVLYLHQTGSDGLYAREAGSPPRLRGWLRTDAEGRYEYRTIRPAPYPSRTIPAHIHTQLWGEGVPRQWNHDLRFADDELVDEAERDASRAAGRFAWLCTPARDPDGTLHCTQDLRLKSRADDFDPAARHGYDDAPAWARP